MVDPAQCAADPACVAATGPENALNPFQPFGGITEQELGYLMASSLKDQYKNNMQNLNLSFNGAFGELQGGQIGWSAGYEWRKESASFIPDEFLGGGLTTGGASDPQTEQASRLPAAAILDVLRSPQSVRQAIILSEILRRPT